MTVKAFGTPTKTRPSFRRVLALFFIGNGLLGRSRTGDDTTGRNAVFSALRTLIGAAQPVKKRRRFATMEEAA